MSVSSINSIEFPRSKYNVRNSILATMPPRHFAELAPWLKLVDLAQDQIICEAGQPTESLYFIESGLVSRSLSTTADDHMDIALVGTNGFVGLSAALGTSTALHQSTVLLSGIALRIDANRLRKCMANEAAIRDLLLRHAAQVTVQISYSALCNARHDIGKRLSRFLLQAGDLVGSTNLPFTHQIFASVLGVRRAGVTETLLHLEAAGAISKARGALQIVDREVLKSHSCDCYERVRQILGKPRVVRFSPQRPAQ